MDVLNGNIFWRKAIKKELAKVRIDFELLDTEIDIKVGSKKIRYRFIFDVKMDLERNAIFVAWEHLNKNFPKHTSYSSVVSQESVRTYFTLAALNDKEILSGDVSNAYLNAKPLETCHVAVRDSYLFESSAIGRTAQIVRALYGMKSTGNAWRLHLSNILEYQLGFKQCYADNDV